MKRRAISFITVLALCLSLCPMRAMAAGWEPDALDSENAPVVIADDIPRYTLSMDTTIKGPYDITGLLVFDTCGYRYTALDAAALRVTGTGRLYLTTGTMESKKEAGIEVQAGGFLCVENAGMTVTGQTYGLDIASSAAVQLSGGTFTGGMAAIRAEDGDHGALLKPGCAYFDDGGNPIVPADVAGKTTVVVKECTAHSYSYTPSPDGAMHDRVCDYCGETITLKCTFNFDENGEAACEFCGHRIEVSISVDESSLVYDGTPRPDSVTVTVTFDGEPLKNTDYHVDITTHINAGETVGVTVSSETYNFTFPKFFNVVKDTPEITWNDEQLGFDYDADKTALLAAIKDALLSNLEIDIKAAEDLSGDIQFSYRDKEGSDAGFTDGLPTNAGTYEVIASLPETQNYHAASSGLISVIIRKIDPAVEAPAAIKPVYNGAVQKLVTNGSAPDGAEIQFAVSESGPWSKDIPTGINAGDYVVWYRVVDEANNYNVVEATPISSVKIKRKEITPAVELEYYTTVYDGGYKEPKVTVRDPEDWKELPGTEYEVTYSGNQTVGTAAVTVTDQKKGNYAITPVEIPFEITPADQAALTITNLPGAVIYGDVFTLSTSGGSGNGTVTWEIMDGGDIAEIGEKTGQVTVKGVGTVTVLATKSEGDSANHKDATAQWTFTADKRPVTAAVTAANKTYDGKVTTTVMAVVEQGVVSGDKITITGLSGTFSDADAGTGKTVTVTGTAEIRVNDVVIANDSSEPYEKYIVTIPATATADIAKVVSRIVTPPKQENTLTYKREAQELLSTGAVPNNQKNIQVEYALSKDGPWSTAFPKATDAGDYEVWYRAQESTNYTAIPADAVVITINPKEVTASDSNVTLTPASYVYDGAEKKPAVTVEDEGVEIPPDEYTVTYSNNVNVGTATVTVTDKAGGNYTVNGTAAFTISGGGSAVLTSSPQANNLTYNGNPQDLVTVGTAEGGTVWYSSTGAADSYGPAIPQETDAGEYTVYYMVKGDSNHTDTGPSRVYVTIRPKTVSSPVITLTGEDASGLYSVTYTGAKQEPTVAGVSDGGVPIGSGEYTVTYSSNVNAGTATVHINDNNGGNYNVSGSKTFEIRKATAEFEIGKEPKAIENLTYNTKAQPLITAGVPEGGTAVYSLGDKNGPYFAAIPTGIDRGEYEVWAKVLGDGNHEDSEPIEIEGVEIGVNTVARPTVELSSSIFRYNGSEQKPTVTVKDDKGNVIPADEYTVTYGGDADDDTIKAGTYQIRIKSKENGSYSFTAECTVTILAAGQTPLTITGKPGTVYYGDTIHLSAAGGTGSGSVEWTVTEGTEYAEIVKTTGELTIKGTGSVTVKAVRTSDTGNYASVEDTWTFYAYPKPVTAVVTAEDKVYGSYEGAKLSVAVPGTDLVVTGVTGTFDDENVGTSKTVTIQSTGATDGSPNYKITYPGTTTASITPAPVNLADITVPAAAVPTYNGSAQDLIREGGAVTGGKWAYSVDGVNFGFVIPKGTDAGEYTVWYKVLADSNHTDTEPVLMEGTTIAPAERAAGDLEVLCTPNSFPYDGTEKTPGVIVMDRKLNRAIPDSEYAVAYSDNVTVGSKTVTVTDKTGGNYVLSGDITGTFEIVAAGQDPFSIVTGIASTVYYGDTFRLSATGGSGSGVIHWESGNTSIAEITPAGVVTVNGVGSFTIKAWREADGSHGRSNEASVSFAAQAKPVTAVVTAANKPYDGNVQAKLSVTVPGTDLVVTGVTGTFDDENVGTDKTVTIHSASATDGSPNYKITYPDTTKASITPASTSLDDITVTAAANDMKYTGLPQALVIAAGTPAGGSLAYSLNGIDYSLVIPTGKDADTYKVWYKVRGDSNHTDSEEKWIEVTIGQETPVIESNPVASPITSGQKLKDSILDGGKAVFDGAEVPGTFTWRDDVDAPESGTEYSVTFTPYDRVNFTTAETKIQVKVTEPEPGPEPEESEEPGKSEEPEEPEEPETPSTTPDTPPSTTPGSGTTTPPAANPGTENASAQTSVRNGTASTVINTTAGNRLVNEAIASQSGNVVIQPKITGDVTKTEVSIPASAVSRISSETDAALTVSTPVADVSIPNGALGMLSSAGGIVSVITERMENTVVLTLTANGKEIGAVPGGLTLTVPVEAAGPGTVAVLIYEDGTCETVRKSVMEGDVLRIPLNGPVTVEIVDNSKKFTDVPADSWAAGAVAFASAREMFNGTSEATFSPELTMSRAMMATVLYNLEGRPDQDLSNEFSDVSGDTWYTAGVSWAAANGVIGGYGNGQVGPNDNITREQLAVMLWRYAGSPAADGQQTLSFTDAGQASDYAVEALYWATTNGILNGYGDGRLDPRGLATRAQAAQMLKNFIENT